MSAVTCFGGVAAACPWFRGGILGNREAADCEILVRGCGDISTGAQGFGIWLIAVAVPIRVDVGAGS